jgi:DNA-binding MarR family transcriptional regulator
MSRRTERFVFDAIISNFDLLMSLNRAEPANMRAVSAQFAIDRTTLATALKPLVRRGLVKVTINPADKRSRSRMGTSRTKSRQSRQCYFG